MLMNKINWTVEQMDNLVVQYFFQLVRTENLENIEQRLNFLLYKIKKNYVKNIKNLVLLYKLIGHTRDIISGKGESQLSYMQIYTWFQFFPNLAQFAFKQFVIPDCKMHPYGSWKDIKHFCHYVKKKSNDENHPLIWFSINLMLTQLARDHYSIFNNSPCVISLAGKWAPRQRSKHWWLFNMMSYQYYNNYFMNVDHTNYHLAKKKAKTYFRKLLSMLNHYLNTPEIFMCSKKWDRIRKISSLSLLKNRKTLLKNKPELFKNLSAKKCSVGQLVKAALKSNSIQEDTLLNKLWVNNSSINKNLKNIIPILDTSFYSLRDKCETLYSAIGLGIRISEKISPFKNRLFIYSNSPKWIIFKKNQTFVQKVKYLYQLISPAQNNFSSVLKLIASKIAKNGLSINEVTKLTFIVLSSKHSWLNENLYFSIPEIFSKAGMRTFGVPYLPPRFIFWNLSSGNEFPAISSQFNVAMISGHNSSNLNFLSKKTSNKYEMKNSYMILENILSSNRYDILAKRLLQLV